MYTFSLSKVNRSIVDTDTHYDSFRATTDRPSWLFSNMLETNVSNSVIAIPISALPARALVHKWMIRRNPKVQFEPNTFTSFLDVPKLKPNAWIHLSAVESAVLEGIAYTELASVTSCMLLQQRPFISPTSFLIPLWVTNPSPVSRLSPTPTVSPMPYWP